MPALRRASGAKAFLLTLLGGLSALIARADANAAALDGWVENALMEQPATEVEDRYRAVLRENRARDAAAARGGTTTHSPSRFTVPRPPTSSW